MSRRPDMKRCRVPRWRTRWSRGYGRSRSGGEHTIEWHECTTCDDGSCHLFLGCNAWISVGALGPSEVYGQRKGARPISLMLFSFSCPRHCWSRCQLSMFEDLRSFCVYLPNFSSMYNQSEPHLYIYTPSLDLCPLHTPITIPSIPIQPRVQSMLPHEQTRRRPHRRQRKDRPKHAPQSLHIRIQRILDHPLPTR